MKRLISLIAAALLWSLTFSSSASSPNDEEYYYGFLTPCGEFYVVSDFPLSDEMQADIMDYLLDTCDQDTSSEDDG